MEKLGLIAGNRKFPLLFAQAAKQRGYQVAAVAVRGETSPSLRKLTDKLYWLELGQFKRMFEIFRQEGVKKIVMAGQISPRRLFSRQVQRSKEIQELLSNIKDKRADTIFGAIAEKLKNAGFELIDSSTFLEDYMPEKGNLTKGEPTFTVWEDIYFGLHLAKAVAYLDIGQSVAVKHKTIVAVEAFEGTDNLIKRSGRLAGRGVTIVKVSKPEQDMRFDIPVIGLKTISNLAGIKASCIAIEARKTLFIDKDEGARLAEKKGIAIVAV